MPPKLTSTAIRTSQTDPINIALYWLIGAILIFAPLFRSGKPALAVMVLELLSVSLLVLILWQPRRISLPRTQTLALALLFAVPLIYLVPLPAGIAEWFPGREPYAAGRALLAGVEGSGLTRLSLYPQQTESALLLLILPVAVFLGVRTLDPPRLLQLVFLLLALASLQSLLGLLQYVASKGSPQLFGMTLADVPSAQGTYTNRNHLAGLLEMVLPIALALMVYSVRRGTTETRRGLRGRLVFLASARGHLAFVYGAVALLLLLGIVFTRSRTGIALSILALLLSTIAFARRIGGNNVYGPTGTIVAFAVGIGIAIGLVPVLDRFSASDAFSDARWTIFSATLDGIGAFAPIGSGPGDYPYVFPLFQPQEFGRWLINHAHNDYLEWLFEGGLFAVVLILLLLFLYVSQWARLGTAGQWSRIRFVKVGAGIGLLMMLLHSLTDFNLHIPANIAYFALLAGVFFSDADDEETEPERRKQRRTQRLSEAPAPSSMPLSAPPTATPNAGNGSLMNRDEYERAQAGDADEHRSVLGAAYNLVHETVARLARRTPSLLLAQLDAASDEDARTQALRALEHRLTTYIRAIERLVDTLEENPQASNHLADPASAQREPDTGGGDREDVRRRSEHLRILQADLETLIASVDLFVDAPGEGDGLSELDTRLGDAEGRLQALLSESSAVAPAAAHPAAPWRPPEHHHRAREKTTATKVPEPRPRESDEQAIPEEERRDATPEEPQPSDIPDAMQDLERAGLNGRVRRLESRIRLDNFLLVILAGLLAASWWWSGALAPEPGDEEGTPELPAGGPEDLLLLPRVETSRKGAQVDMPADTDSADQETGIQLPGAAVEFMENQVPDLSLRKATEAPLVQEGSTPTGERDSVPPGTAEPVPDDSPDTGRAESSPDTEVSPPHDGQEGGVSEAPAGKKKEATSEHVGARTLKEPRFGIQLVAFKNESDMRDYIRNSQLGDNALYAHSATKEGNWYIVAKGFYPTREEAQNVAETLPAKLKSLGPWVKRYPAGMTYYPIDSQ